MSEKSGAFDKVCANYATMNISPRSSDANLISILMLNGHHPSVAHGIADMIAMANEVESYAFGRPKDPLKVQMLCVDDPCLDCYGTVSTQAGRIADCEEFGSVIVVPGCAIDPASLSEHIDSHLKTARWLKQKHDAGYVIAAMCSSIFLLAEAGLLDERQAAATWWAQPLMKLRYPRVNLLPDARLTEDSGIICAAGPFSHPALALRLVERQRSRALTSMCAKYALIERNPPLQSVYVTATLTGNDLPLLYRIAHIVRENLPDTIAVTDVAKALGMSVRTLERQVDDATGSPPKALIDRIRFDVAKEMLEASDLSIQKIMAAVGYGNESSFRRGFRRYTTMTPTEYKNRYSLRTGNSEERL